MQIQIFIHEKPERNSSFWSMPGFEVTTVASGETEVIEMAVEAMCIIRSSGVDLPNGAEFVVKNLDGEVILEGDITPKKVVISQGK